MDNYLNNPFNTRRKTTNNKENNRLLNNPLKEFDVRNIDDLHEELKNSEIEFTFNNISTIKKKNINETFQSKLPTPDSNYQMNFFKYKNFPSKIPKI